jgi:hypothetical protein
MDYALYQNKLAVLRIMLRDQIERATEDTMEILARALPDMDEEQRMALWARLTTDFFRDDRSPEAFAAEGMEYRTASRERRIELEAKWGARADYFREG